MASQHVGDQKQFWDLAQQISNRIQFHGAWFFQTREDRDGIPHVLEFAPRIAGTMSVSRLRGVNLPLLSLYEMDRYPVEIRELPIDVRVDRALVERVAEPLTPSVIYVDLDDTLVFRERVNTDLAACLLAAKDRGARIEIVTRHDGEPTSRLERLGLAGLFDAVHHLKFGEPKSSVITDPDGVLVDDSFSERNEAMNARGVLAIDCSMTAVLVTDRC